MKTFFFIVLVLFQGLLLRGGVVEKTFSFGDPAVSAHGGYQTITFAGTLLSALPGQPVVPWQAVVLVLPPGEEAVSMEITESLDTEITGSFLLFPKQTVRPISSDSAAPFLKNDNLYLQDMEYPAKHYGHLLTQYLNGYAIALASFTPMHYNPAKRSVHYFRQVTVRITTRTSAKSMAAMRNLPRDEQVLARVRSFAMNPAMMLRYPLCETPATSYQYLIISPPGFKSEFQPLVSMYAEKGILIRVAPTDSILTNVAGTDLQDKIRNLIIGQYQASGIQYVLLAGNPSLVPCRGFYCHVMSGSTPYEDSNIPADLYYSGLDGNFNANGNLKFGEMDDEPDLLPDISVGRFTVNDTAELHRMIRKTISYQNNPVLGEFAKPLLAGEYLYNAPVTFGSDYMDLLVGDHTDNGYFTHGIPPATNQIGTLYDSIVSPPLTMWQWTPDMLLTRLNQGNSFIHHLGHANTTYMLRLSMGSVTNANFSQVNGIIHNFQLLYTQGCYDGAFDAEGGCIAARAVTIDNFLVAGVFNSRYGWFNQGTTDGPSQHLEREFVSALYHETTPERHLGTAHMISKIKTMPWITLPGEFEPGAQRWCHYCCNVFGDPALEIRTEEPASFTTITWTGALDSDWNKAGNWDLSKVPTTLFDVIIPVTPHHPVIATVNATYCHDLTIQGGGKLTVNPGKSMVVYGTVTVSGE